MTGTLQMIINGKVELSKAVIAQLYVEKLTSEWKTKMLPALAESDTWEIVLRVFSDWNGNKN